MPRPLRPVRGSTGRSAGAVLCSVRLGVSAAWVHRFNGRGEWGIAMSERAAGQVVVGIDGSGTARGAVRWAAREAVRRGVLLRIVYADVFALPVLPGLPGVSWPRAQRTAVRAEVEKWLAQAAEAASRESSSVAVETASCAGYPASVLVDESSRAGLVVVGDRGLGGFDGLLAGSVPVAVAAHGHSATVVVRGDDERAQGVPNGPVVVGLDGSPHTRVLLEHGFDAATAFDVPLHVVHSWMLGIDKRLVRLGSASGEIQSSAERLVSELLGGWSEQYPDVVVDRFVTEGSPASALLERAGAARLVIVGARGRGGFTGLLLGSTSQALIHHSPCPVMVLRTPKS